MSTLRDLILTKETDKAILEGSSLIVESVYAVVKINLSNGWVTTNVVSPVNSSTKLILSLVSLNDGTSTIYSL